MKKTAKKWFQEIQRAQHKAKQKRIESTRFKEMYSGNIQTRHGKKLHRDTVKVNHVFGVVDLVMPTILADDPKIRAIAKNEKSQESVDLFERNTNYWAREKDTREEFKDALFDSFFHASIVYAGWDHIAEKVTRRADKEFENPLTGELLQPGQTFEAIEVIQDEPFLRWIDYWDDYAFDPDVKKFRQRNWEAIGLTIKRHIFNEMENIKDEFKQGGKREIKPQIRPEDQHRGDGMDGRSHDNMEHEGQSEIEWIRIWEIWDRPHKRRFYVAENVSDFLEKDNQWPFEFEVGDDPWACTRLPAKPAPKGPHDISEFEPIEDQIFERIRLRTVQAGVVRKLAPKYLGDKRTATKAEMKKFLNSNMMSYNEMLNPAGLRLAPVPQIPSGFFEFDKVIEDDIRDISGKSEMDQGRISQTATEANIVQGNTNVRRTSRSNQFEFFVSRCLAKMGYLCQQFQTVERTMRINDLSDPMKAVKFRSVTKEQIQGEFDVEVIPGSMEHKNQLVERREMARLSEVISGSPEVNQRKWLSKLLQAHNMDPSKIFLTDEEKQQIKPEPTIDVEKLKLKDMSPVDQLRVIEELKKQHNIQNLDPAPAQQAQQQMQQIDQGQRTAFPENQQPGGVTQEGLPGTPIDQASLESDNS